MSKKRGTLETFRLTSPHPSAKKTKDKEKEESEKNPAGEGDTQTSQFLDDQRDEDDYLSDSTTLSLVVSTGQAGRSINTTVVIVLEILLLIAVWVLAFVLPVVYKDESSSVEAFSLIVYVMGGVWVIQFLIDRFYRQQHYHSRLYGYLSFYRKTRVIRRIPLLIASGANTALLVVIEVIRLKCADIQGKCGPLTRVNWLQIVVSISCGLQIVVLLIYLVRTVSFNRSKASPDVHQEEFHTSFQTNSTSADIGFRDENLTDQVLERQADMIRYLKNHSSQLAKRIVALNEELKNLKQRK